MELLSDIKPSNLDLVSYKTVNLKEFVQDDADDFQSDSDCPLSTEKVVRLRVSVASYPFVINWALVRYITRSSFIA